MDIWVIAVSVLITTLVFNLYKLLRIELTHRYKLYWIDKILQYQIYCMVFDIESKVDYDDIMDFDDYLYKMFTFSKKKMIKDKYKPWILKNYLKMEV